MKMKYQPGDIVGVPTKGGISLLLNRICRLLITPSTELHHFFVIRTVLTEENDYEIMEAIASGIKMGRLSWYEGKGYRVFRIPDPTTYAKAPWACATFSRFGRAKYDLGLYFKLFLGAFVCWQTQLLEEKRLRKIRPEEFPYGKDDEFICTEVAYEISYLMGYPIVDPNTASIPPAIQDSVNKGRIIEVT
jgi:hypothetical protein